VFESQASSALFSFDGQAAVFRDHFPDEPLVPAFMQISAVRRYVTQNLKYPPEQILVRNLKFIRPLRPDEEVSLRLKSGTKAGAVRFELVRGDEVVTQGELGIR
jgi:3-hydroxymyristoyl/3-hydroxydecanoyl-(acyl carrier protein) dehydratase